MELNDKKIINQTILDFFKACESKNKMIGIEGEKVGIYSGNWKPPRYSGKNGYLAILGRLHDELGWEIMKQEGKFILDMRRCKTNLSLESDGRIELAGSPHESIHDLAREFRIHQNEIKEISEIFGINWLGVGYHPFSMNRDIEDIPIARKLELVRFYQNIKEKTGNDFGLAWLKKTSGIHVNIDYTSEEDFAIKSRVFMRLAPVLSAMFANSPFSKRRFTGYMSYRRHVEHHSHVPHLTISKRFYESEFKYQDWIDEVISFPIITLKKAEQWIHPPMNFKSFMEEGFDGHHATWGDLEMHMKTMWMDVRMRNVIELRSIDSLPPNLVPSVAALIKGLAYDDNTMKDLKKMTDSWNYGEWQALQNDAAKLGLQAKINGTRLLDVANELLIRAEENLKSEKILDINGNDESIHLDPIQDFIFVKGKSPAEWLVEKWLGEWNKNFYPVVEWWKY